VAEERLKSIIEVGFVGDGFDQYMAKAVKAGAVTEEVAQKINRAFSGGNLLQDIRRIEAALNGITDPNINVQALSQGLSRQLEGATTGLRRSIDEFESAISRGARNEIRQTLGMVLTLEQAIRRLPDLNSNVRLTPLGGGGLAQQALTPNTSQVAVSELMRVIRPLDENTAALKILAASMRSGYAVDQPARIGVTERGQYGVLDGSQRVQAAQMAGIREIPATLEYVQRAKPHFGRDPELAALVRQLGSALGSSRTLAPGMLGIGAPGEISARQFFPGASALDLQQGQYQAGAGQRTPLLGKAPDALFTAVQQLEQQALAGPIERIKRATYGSQGGKASGRRQTESLLDELNVAAHQVVQGTVLEAKKDALRALPAGGRAPLALGAGSGSSTISASFYQRELETAMLAAGGRGNFAEAERLGSIADYRPNARSGAQVPRNLSAEASDLANETGRLEAELAKVDRNLKDAARTAGYGQKAAKELAYETNRATAAARFESILGFPGSDADDLPAGALSTGRLTKPNLKYWLNGRGPGDETSERLGALFGMSSGSPLTELDWGGGTHNAQGRALKSRSETSYQIPGFLTVPDAQKQLLSEFSQESKYEAQDQQLRTQLIATQRKLEAVRAEIRQQAAKVLGQANAFIGPSNVTALGAARQPLAINARSQPQVVQGTVLSSTDEYRTASGKPDPTGAASRQAHLDRVKAERDAERAAGEQRLREAQAVRDRAAAAVQQGRQVLAGGSGFGGGGGIPPRPPTGGGPGGPDDDWMAEFLRRLKGLRPEAASILAEIERALVSAKIKLEQVQAKARLPLGAPLDDDGPAGYSDEPTRAKAIADAEKAEIAARRRYTTALDQLTQGTNTLRLSLAQQMEQHRELERAGAISPQQRVGYDVAAAKREETLAKQGVEKLRGTSFADTEEGQAEYKAALQRLTGATAAVGRAQSEQKALIDADNAAQRAETASAKELAAAQNVAAAEQRKSAAAANKQAASSQRVAAASQRTFGQNFATGFGGRPDADGQTRPYAEQLGQAAKFSVFYGAAYQILFAVTATLTATLQESIEFQQAMTDLTLAAGRTGAEMDALGNSLGDSAVEAGFAPSQGVQLGARSLGLYGATSASGAEQDRVSRISAEVASRVAVGAKKDPLTVQGDIAAVTQALGVGVEGQFSVADLDAYMTKKFGVTQGGTLETLAQSGSVGIAAGFDTEQLFAIAAQLQSRTNQTPSTVAGYMAQIFSRGGEGSLVDVAKKTGVDPTQELAGIVEDLARIYKDADPTQRAEISSAFGRGKVQSAAISLLTDFPEIQKTVEGARTGATGEADRQFETRMNNLGGEIAKMVGQLKGVAGALGESGLLDPVGVLVVSITELAKAANSLLSVWNLLPNVIQDTIIGLAALGLLTKTKTGAGILGAGAEFLGGRTAAKAGGAGLGLIGPATESGAFFSSSGKSLLSSAVRFALPIGAAVGGLLAVGSLVDTVKKMKSAEAQTDALLKNIDLGPGATAEQYGAKASELDAQARRNREATGNVAQILTLGHANDSLVANADILQAEADRLRGVAESLRDLPEETRPKISGFDPDNLTQSLGLIASSGGTAETQFRALEDALTGSTNAANKAAQAFKPDVLASQFTDAAVNNIDQVPGSDDPFSITKPGGSRYVPGGRGGPGVKVALPDEEFLGSELIPPEFRNVIAKRAELWLAHHGVESFKDLDAETAAEMAGLLGENAIFDDIATDNDLSQDQVDALREQFVDSFRRQVLSQTKDWRKLLRENKRLTDEDLTSVLSNIGTLTQGRLEATATTDLGGRVQIMRQQLRLANRARSQASGDGIPAAILFAGKAREALAEAEIAKLEAARRAAQQNAATAREVRQIGRASIRKQIAAAVRGGSRDALAEVISRAGDGAIAVARQAINAAIATAQAAADLQRRMLLLQASIAGPVAALAAIAQGVGLQAGLDKEIKGLNNLADSLSTAVTGGPEAVSLTGSDVPGVAEPPKIEEPKAPKKGKTKEQREAEREAARQEMLDLRNSLYLLSVDLSDPLAQATAAVKDARRRLASDIGSGQSKAQIAGDRVSLRQAEMSREQTAFDQRLQRMQTNEELGRITHRKYMGYLESEKRRLDAIKDRTYQQQQQLDTIDRAMKEAASSMDAMWNFGDIKLPTPYQIRRVLGEQTRQQQATPIGRDGYMQQGNTQIWIDGADVGKVRQVITEVLGKANATVTTRPRRR